MNQLIGKEQLHIQKKRFNELDINDSFFDSLKKDYNFGKNEFEVWFKKKADEMAFLAIDDNNKLYGFLYFKIEDKNEDYSNFSPSLPPKKRLKIGTFKVESEPKGQKMGERFLGFVFDNAKECKVDEIYVTIFDEREYTQGLIAIFKQWGFLEWGVDKKTGEKIYIKNLNKSSFDSSKNIKWNFPVLKPNHNYFFLPINPEFHNELIPEHIVKYEKIPDYDPTKPYRNALEKVYVSRAKWKFRQKNPPSEGDLILLYRMGRGLNGQKYKSVVTTVAVISEIFLPSDKITFFDFCKNRSIFDEKQLEKYWKEKNGINLAVIKFIPLYKMPHNVVLNELWDVNIISPGSGPQSFDVVSKENFDKIIKLSKN
ncbi:hypothetical protein LD125_00046 [Mesoplasma sp. JKS002658]|uniref:hypothetical protein n=1 Tax=Mesoplasma whartonense TaxID=2878854 RepID=UPI002022B1E6|nr:MULTISPECIES: hypothetical protein [unclassified Mesoplasma]MCL8211704.1 hypothetical protein [Mesoplasma sp. JKS002664]MCL8212081.1 hypothetical protein [Mesoplasma sp. JKS002662]MCL8213814.1 hypothetical protein [Mesoplasma sp. JKS002658]MCL8215040.1 hypothetical protein [Mesoplasma sp. JKS002663]MCL8215133.1 hypothetical protein [Mesoplasma sp. JKS002659]